MTKPLPQEAELRERLIVKLDTLCSRVGGDFMRNVPIEEAADQIMKLVAYHTREAENKLASDILRQADYMVQGGELVHAVSTDNIKAVVPSIKSALSTPSEQPNRGKEV